MLNYNEIKIVATIQDKEILEYLNVLPTALEEAVIMAKKEIEELEEDINYGFENGETFENLCKRLKGDDAIFNSEYPNYNSFSIPYGSLYLTIEEPIDENNNKLKPIINKEEISVYPDNICDMMGTDSLFTLNFNEDINFEKINDFLKTQGINEIQEVLKKFFNKYVGLKECTINRIENKKSICDYEKLLDKKIDRYDYMDLLKCMVDLENECYNMINFSKNRLNEINLFKSIYMETKLEENEDIQEEIEM